MLQGKLFIMAALLAALLFTGPAFAQEPNADCERAKQYLFEQYNRVEPENNERYYNIWASPECVNYRRKAELSVDAEIASNEELIRSRNSDYDMRLAQIPALCEPIVDQRWAAASEKFRSQQNKSELLAACIRNQSHSLRGEYLNRVNEESAAQYAEKLRLNQEQIAADEQAYGERQSAYEMKMEQWRDAVKRCEAGQFQYCSSRF